MYPTHPTHPTVCVAELLLVPKLEKASLSYYNTNGLRRPAPCTHRSPHPPSMGLEAICCPLAYSCMHRFMQSSHTPPFQSPSQTLRQAYHQASNSFAPQRHVFSALASILVRASAWNVPVLAQTFHQEQGWLATSHPGTCPGPCSCARNSLVYILLTTATIVI